MTPVEYLAFERAAREKHIYWRGEVFAMSGASRQHVKISGNTFYQIRKAFDDSESDCEIMYADMRVKNERTGSCFYPDILATCNSPKFEDNEFDTQDKMYFERYTHSGDSTWEYCSASLPDDILALSSIDVQILLSDVYAKVEFDPENDEDTDLKVVEEKSEFQVPG